MTSDLKVVSVSQCFEGKQFVYSHYSNSLKCEIKFSLYQPPQATKSKVPVIYFLSGLTSSEQEFIQQCAFQKYASEHGICVVGPDTFPRSSYPKDATITRSQMAAMYLDATTEGWKDHYQMYSYVSKELIQLVESNFNFCQKDNRSIMGHSMGGHGALVISLRNPGLYKCCSVFAPIYNLDGETTLVDDKVSKEDIKNWDATQLMRNYKGPSLRILIDQGAEDYILGLFSPDRFIAAALENKTTVSFNLHEGYDHSYMFVKTFIGRHFDHHAKILKSTKP